MALLGLGATSDLSPQSAQKRTYSGRADAMVHFEYDAVLSYIQDAFRILKRDGRALFHHSNLDKYPGSDYKHNPHRRNFMSKNLFAHAAARAGFQVLEQITIDWAGFRNLGCLTLLEKPSDCSHVIALPVWRSGNNVGRACCDQSPV